MSDENLTIELLERMADVLRVLAHRDRLRIIEHLDLHGTQPVSSLVKALGMPQATVSHHLSRMKVAGLVAAERRERHVWYSIADPNSLTILNCIRKKRSHK
ncbi:MAG: winged helix-turn-helix transcriptional regulator [Verrucomicrobia bacterium]|jgi:ArsR family transcriptional regulator, zinc-responsive transcriptional repressor|nr:winged helix-turn-helix transcriptional regulator [Verrucomicrobiota bacterium]